jgi:4-amino-4-deoxy-L-arabinose transferase-like glycosyltransferase
MSNARTFVKAHTPALLIIFIAAALRTALAMLIPLEADETYYWEWSRHLDFGYYDQGPLVAWCIRAFRFLFGESSLGVRGHTIVAFATAQALLYALASRIAGRKVAITALLLYTVMPWSLLHFKGSYESLLLMFWSMAMYFTLALLVDNSKFSWIGIGLSVGLGSLAKYTMLLFLPCLFLFLLSAGEYRRWVRSRRIWTAVALAIVVLLPNILWLSAHGWSTLHHMSVLSATRSNTPVLSRIGEFLGSQVGFATPLVFFVCCAGLWHAFQVKSKSAPSWFLFCFSAPVFAAVLLSCFTGAPRTYYTATAWIAACIAAALWLASPTTKSKSKLTALTLATSVLISAVIFLPVAVSGASKVIPLAWTKQIVRCYGGAELAAEVQMIKDEMEVLTGRHVGVCGVSFTVCARLSYYLRAHPYAPCFFLGTRPNNYMYWNRQRDFVAGQDIIAVDRHPPGDAAAADFSLIFERVEYVKSIEVGWAGYPYTEYFVYRCYGLRVEALTEDVLFCASGLRMTHYAE